MKNVLSNTVIAAMCALAAAASTASADTIAFSPTNGGFSSNFGAVGNDGFFFTPTTNIYITNLGYYQDGLAHQDQVGIYQVSDDSLLVSTSVTVPATIGNNPTDPPLFTYVPVSVTELTAGTEYAVVGLEANNLAGQYVTNGNNVNPASGITFNGYFYDYNNTLDLPTNSYSDAYFGPNFQFTTTETVVPLPAPALSGCAMLGLMLLVKMRRRKLTA